MQILFLDLETTGLDPAVDQVLEVGAVIETYPAVKPIDELPKFHAYVKHDRIHGHPYALAMNQTIIRMMADRESSKLFLPETGVAIALADFLTNFWIGDGSITVGGKNVAAFDMRFLEKLPGFKKFGGQFSLCSQPHPNDPQADSTDEFKFSHRSVDPALLYFYPEDTKLPNLQTCLDRAGINSTVKHTAVDDALDCVRLMRAFYGVKI